MEILEFIREEFYVLIAVVWVIGVFLKNTPLLNDWAIPWILLIVSVALAVALNGFTADAVVQGILVCGGAVLVHQLIKQTKEGAS